MEKYMRSIKVVLIFAGVFAFRLIPLRAPNVEPILASAMPLSKRYGALSGALFGALSIVAYDAVTSGWGSWTLVTAVAYALVGLGAGVYFRHRTASRGNFVAYSVVSVLFYDAVTGLTIGPIFNGQSFATALSGQIPFTALHLAGSVAFAALVSPVLYRWLETSEVFSFASKKVAIS